MKEVLWQHHVHCIQGSIEIEDFVSIFASDKDNPKLSQYILIDSRQLHETITLLSPTNSRKETNDFSFKG